MPRRSTDQIIADILEVCLKPGVAKTNVVYRANLNFKTAMPYLDLLTGRGLLEAVPGRSTIYKTTAKGKMALKALRAIEEIIPERLDCRRMLFASGGGVGCLAGIRARVDRWVAGRWPGLIGGSRGAGCLLVDRDIRLIVLVEASS